MADFLLDCRPRNQRRLADAAHRLTFAPRIQSSTFDLPHAGLVHTHTGPAELWAPAVAPDGSILALAGHPAFDESDWLDANASPAIGGLASRLVLHRFLQHGPDALEHIHGNCAVLLLQTQPPSAHLVTDCAGALPTFECLLPQGPVFASHPDVLARVTDEDQRLDETSLAEFLFSSTVTPPHTYYQRIQATPHASHLTFSFSPHNPTTPSRRSYFDFSFQPDPPASLPELGAELAHALRLAIRRRTLPRLGPVAVALSGGLDSRALLSAIEDRQQTFAFCCHDQPNREFLAAQAVAQALDTRFLPLRRPFEYYGNHAALGVRVSGGMGTFANNHFLGVLDQLHQEGMQVLLTGCYFDYLFKGLPLNRQSHPLTGRESLAPFRHQFYFGHRLPNSPFALAVRDRWENRIPLQLRTDPSAEALFQIECRRSLPLCYEGDNQQRVVPQRLTGWCLPVADRDVLRAYRRLPSAAKLNRQLFLHAFQHLADPRLARVPDANTGLPPGAHPLASAFLGSWFRLRRRLTRHRDIATDGSWPNWNHYVLHSQQLAHLWNQPQPQAEDLFRRILGPQAVRPNTRDYAGSEVFLLVAMLTLKLWFAHRA